MKVKPVGAIVLCGGSTIGHVSAALAVYEQLVSTYSLDGSAVYVHEASGPSSRYLAESSAVTGVALKTAKFRTSRSWKDLCIPPRLVYSTVQAAALLVRHKAALVVSGGGHSAVPVVVAAKLLRVPVIAHEQTRDLGLANKVIFAGAAVKLAAYPLDRRDIVVTGALCRDLSSASAPCCADEMVCNTGLPLLFVAGGSQGSRQVNEWIWRDLESLLTGHVVVHQTGEGGLEAAKAHAGRLTPELRARYRAVDSLPEADYSWLMRHCDKLVSRSGAGTMAQLSRNPDAVAVLVPLSSARGGEQQRLAVAALTERAGTIVTDTDTGPTVTAVLAAVKPVPRRQQAADSIHWAGHAQVRALLGALARRSKS